MDDVKAARRDDARTLINSFYVALLPWVEPEHRTRLLALWEGEAAGLEGEELEDAVETAGEWTGDEDDLAAMLG